MNSWNPQQKPTNTEDVEKLIFSLTDGVGIWFGTNKEGKPSDYDDWIEKRSNGSEYFYIRGMTKYDREEIETDEEIIEIAKEIAKNQYLRYYSYQSIQDYSKSRERYSQEDDQQVGDYEKYGPDRITWQDVTQENKTIENFMKENLQVNEFSLKKIVENLGKIPADGGAKFGNETQKLSHNRKKI